MTPTTCASATTASVVARPPSPEHISSRVSMETWCPLIEPKSLIAISMAA